MFALAILLGIYSFVLFLLGILGLLYPQIIFIATILFVLLSFYYFRKEIREFKQTLKKRKFDLDNFSKLILILISAQALVNFIGALGPELSFDALWYHLTLPKIFLEAHRIFHIPGGLLYYSDMPKLGEMLNIGALSFGNEVTAHVIHFVFGLLCLVALFKLSRKFFDFKFSLLTSLIFYSSLVVGWESTTAYVDLTRTFFEIMAFWGFVNWHETREKKWIIESAVMFGLAISSKLIAVGSLPIFVLLFLILSNNKREAIKNSLIFVLISLLIPFPWFFFSFLNTGNPIYPMLTGLYSTSFSPSLLNPVNFVKSVLTLLIHSSDPISPIYLIVLPLIPVFYKKFDTKIKIISLYSLFAIIIWYVTPQTGGGRFILPYLPVFSILATYLIIQKKELIKFLISIVILISITSIGYRFLANSKFIPVIVGKQTKQEFLTKYLNFNYGDFYDTDGYFKQTIKPKDKVLLYGFHNLYYVDFPFIDNSYVQTGDKFNYIAVQNSEIPKRFSYWNLIYENPITHVKLYWLGGGYWYY